MNLLHISFVSIIFLSLIVFLALLIFIVRCRIRFQRQKSSRKVIAFFHPYCASGGGGERVLWKAIQVLGDMYEGGSDSNIEIVIYTIDKEREDYKEDVLEHVRSRFLIAVSDKLPLSFVHLDQYAHFLEPCQRFSMVAESWGTMKLAYRALELCTPHVFFDTTGCAFTFACAKVLAGCRVAAYVHYPTISTDMLSLIWKRRPSYNHDVDIAKSRLTTIIKLLYYVLFAVMYGSVGSMADLVLVNSSWTYSHISFLWRGAVRRIKIVFPPCDVTSLMNLSVAKKRERLVLSIGQFRPEKDHELQIRAFSRLRENNPDMHDVKLILLGSCRGKGDEDRVEIYRKLVKSLGLADCVDFVLNQPYSVVKEWLGRASVGLHTMWNEHFGIGVVEMMAAGLLTIAHNSGGPKADIIVPFKGHRTGFLAGTVEEYADAMLQALNMDPADMLEMRGNARASSLRFSDEVFCSSLQKSVAESILLR